ncbi:MAG TPA: SAM-dependent methyltransferase [Thermomicrobiales bacterium]|jgi:SAM-dependent MidA family methyltransferase|nr:SAM-dependent methyltransferase [Thermomicrobiales bacterium]
MTTTDPSPTPPVSPGNPALIAIIRDTIDRAGGRITFARFMDLALNHPEHGYYRAPERRPGRGGDFLTAPETTPWFGFIVARQIAECRDRLGRSEPFTIHESGAGIGGLAYDIVAALLDHDPDLRATLSYRLSEPNPHRRAQAIAAMREVGLDDVVRVEDPTVPGYAPEPITGVVLANEVADALPVHRLTVRDGELAECYVRRDGDGFAEEIGPVSEAALADGLPRRLQRAGVSLSEGDRLDVSPAATSWFRDLVRPLRRGYALVIDYGYAADELYRGHRLSGTLRTYASHVAGDDPFVRIGEQDLTAHVDFTALQDGGLAEGLLPAGLTSQSLFLERLGLGQVLLDAQDTPGMTPEDYLALRAGIFRLIDPAGMGRFSVLAMARDAPVDPPLLGFG